MNIREILKTFAPKQAPNKTLCWEKNLEGEDGAGARIALLDSGLNWSEQAFAGARILGRDFTGDGGMFDPTYHGTANAALLVGRNRDDAAGAISPGCELLVAKVLGHRAGDRTVVAIRAALHWAICADCDIIVMPFGTTRGAASIACEIRTAVTKGCKVFAAAGNRGSEQICFPSWLPEVTAVSALAHDGSVYPGCCARGDVDLYVWGERVPVVGLREVAELSGSSPATVLAAGFAALQKGKQLRKCELE